MNSDLTLVRSLRRVLESAGEGSGMARSVVEGLRNVPPLGSESARRVLLGHPLGVSLRPLIDDDSGEASMLASLIVAAPRTSASAIGRSGGELAGTLERWVRAREGRRMEQRVLRFRSVVTSGVLGAVTAMMASLGPLIGNLNFGASVTATDPSTLLLGAAAMATVSSAMLGLYMSGRSFVVNVAVTLGVFAMVSAVASPLVSIPSEVTWGVK